MNNGETNTLYKALAKAILLAAGVIILLWFLFKIMSVLLLLLFAMVLAIIINNPVSWLQTKTLSVFGLP